MKRLFVVLMALVLVTSPILVNAAGVARFNVSSSVTTQLWSATILSANQGATNNPHQLSWSVSGGSAYSYFAVQNSGTTVINKLTLAISQIRNGGNGAANEVFFDRCINGSWLTATNTCTGTVAPLGKASDLNLYLNNLNFQIGSQLEIQARTAVSGRNNFLTYVEPKVDRSGIRAASIFNS